MKALFTRSGTDRGPVPVVVSVVIKKLDQTLLMPDGHPVLALVAHVVGYLDKFALVSLYLGFLLSPLLLPACLLTDTVFIFAVCVGMGG
jgi:hypothetical protein